MSGEYDVEALKKKLTHRQLINWFVYFQHKDDGLPEIGRIEWYLMQICQQLICVAAGLGVDKVPNITTDGQIKIKRIPQEESNEQEREKIKAEHEAFFGSFSSIIGKE